MAYPALPDRRMPYDNDGTVVYSGTPNAGSADGFFGMGPVTVLSGTDKIKLNSVQTAADLLSHPQGWWTGWWFFFPEQREVAAYVFLCGSSGSYAAGKIEGSNDTTNGMDGTWETAALGSGASYGTLDTAADVWRSGIKPISFTGPKRVIRIANENNGAFGAGAIWGLHIYGEKAAGQTPDDIVYLDGLTSYAEFTAPEDFGDVPLATTSTRTFKVKNASATHTANTINIQCNDADFAISTDNVTWVVTINIASLAAGASSGVMYVRNTSPAIGSALGPRFARIVTTVASWT